MERLTKQWGENHAVPTNIDLDFVFDLDDKTYNGLTKILDRLAEFEDAEEQRNKGCAWCIDRTIKWSIINDDFGLHIHPNIITHCFHCGRKLKECEQK